MLDTPLRSSLPAPPAIDTALLTNIERRRRLHPRSHLSSAPPPLLRLPLLYLPPPSSAPPYLSPQYLFNVYRWYYEEIC